MSLHDRWLAKLATLHQKHRYRQLLPPAGIDFASNDYLGYGKRPYDRLAADRGELSRSGQASRLLRGHDPIWDNVEADLAKWHGTESALMYASGYQANIGLFTAIIEPTDWVASDQWNHASIIDGLGLCQAERFIYRHRDLNHLEEGLGRFASNRSPGQEGFIVTESLFSMEGTRAPLARLAELASRFGVALIVDEAHATGCLGPNGDGLVADEGIRSRVCATVHTGGKALGVVGAYVCVSKLLKEFLINRSRPFIFSTALPPLVGTWWQDVLTRVAEDQQSRKALQEATTLFRGELRRHGIMVEGDDYIVPIIIGDEHRALNAGERLQGQGWDIRAVRPPSVPEGSSRLRISIHADHSPDVLVQLAQALSSQFQS